MFAATAMIMLMKIMKTMICMMKGIMSLKDSVMLAIAVEPALTGARADPVTARVTDTTKALATISRAGTINANSFFLSIVSPPWFYSGVPPCLRSMKV